MDKRLLPSTPALPARLYGHHPDVYRVFHLGKNGYLTGFAFSCRRTMFFQVTGATPGRALPKDMQFVLTEEAKRVL